MGGADHVSLVSPSEDLEGNAAEPHRGKAGFLHGTSERWTHYRGDWRFCGAGYLMSWGKSRAFYPSRRYENGAYPPVRQG